MFKIIKKDKKTKARLGVLKTPHGTVETPAYVMVATKGHIKCLEPSDIKKTKTQIVISNTYHLWNEALTWAPCKKHGAHVKNGFLLNKLGTKIPTMTDSGGFQVFSLAFGREKGVKKIFPNQAEKTKKLKRKNIKITEKGVYFKLDDPASPPPSLKLWRSRRLRRTWKFLSPEISMKIQEKLGADIIFAFDECTSFFDGFKYNKKAMERTHKWALECLESSRKSSRSLASGTLQMLFGIVQGGKYKNLRVESAKFIGSLPFDGFGIGGSFGKKEMVKMLKWVIPHLPEEKPRHLLGVGQVEDIFRAVENGVDLFDCVIPTREARHGRLYTKKGRIDIRRGYFSKDKNPIEKLCKCPTCKSKVSKSKIRELIKNNEPIWQARGQRYALMHNMWFFNQLLEDIRNSIAKGKFKELKNRTLTRFKS